MCVVLNVEVKRKLESDFPSIKKQSQYVMCQNFIGLNDSFINENANLTSTPKVQGLK